MTKFVFNPKSGMMDMKKDKQIYFGGSQGGGLRVDDHKHNIKFIIEKDGTITNLFGLYDSNVAIYDMMDAKNIANRVMHKFGSSHEYSNYKMFLKGYKKNESYVMTFDEFVNESVLGNMILRQTKGGVRKEDGVFIGTVNGKNLILPNDNIGVVVRFDNNKYYYFEQLDVYIVTVNDGEEDTYYIYDPNDSHKSITMRKWFHSNKEIRENDFGWLHALVDASSCTVDDLDDMETEFYCNNNGRHRFIFHTSEEYCAYDNEDDAKKDAVEAQHDIFHTCGIEKGEIERWRTMLGDDFININAITDTFKDMYKDEYDNFDNEDKIQGLLDYEIIEDTDEYFKTDEDGNTNHDEPTFDPDDYTDKYVDGKMKGMSDNSIIDEYFAEFGYDDIFSVIDDDVLADEIVEYDGPANSLATYDGASREEEVNGRTYFLYKVN